MIIGKVEQGEVGKEGIYAYTYQVIIHTYSIVSCLWGIVLDFFFWFGRRCWGRNRDCGYGRLGLLSDEIFQETW